MLHKIKLTTEGQKLTCESVKIASGLVENIECEFVLDSSWNGYDYLRALFTDAYGNCIEQTITNNKVNVPNQCLWHRGWCKVNLCAYNVTGTTRTLQMTSYMTIIADVEQEVALTGANNVPPATEVWEQELLAHTSNTSVHTNATEKATWNAKVGEAPSDNKQYARKNGAWTEVHGGGGSTDWNDITNKPSTFPPSAHNQSWSTITDKPTIPSKTSDLTNDSGFIDSSYHDDSKADKSTTYTKTETDSAISGHHDSSKVDKVEGKGLSTNDYTDADKTKVGNAITEHQSLSAYRTSADQDVIDNTKEASSNKVTSVSSASTDTEYPSAKCVYDGLALKRPAKVVKSVMDAVAIADAEYYLGLQTSVSISMPTDANVGQEILVCFTSGATACTLTVDLTGFSFVPKANKTSWLKFTLYHKADVSVVGDEDKWLCECKEG